jgi:hypothetical protein
VRTVRAIRRCCIFATRHNKVLLPNRTRSTKD